MATLALAAVGSAIGGALLPSGVGALGIGLSGAALGSQVGALAGSFVDNALFGSSGRTRKVEGPRLSDLQVVASTEGAPIPRVYGSVRVGGQIIWATPIEERVTTTTRSQGGGKGGGSPGAKTTSTTYTYFSNFAVALSEGEIGGIGRVWANGTELDLASLTYRVYTGSETQAPDSLIAARLGAASAPAYRGTAYVVFEALPLAAYGNRIPQLSFEVYRPVEPFATEIRSVVMIPGAGEFVYDPAPVISTFGTGGSNAQNTHTRQGGTDWQVSLDQLGSTLPNIANVSLVVSWFGTDLRAAHCRVRPGVENREKSTSPYEWSVAGETRATALLVSTKDGRPAYGGTPADQSVVSAILDLKSRGYSVTLTPFILLDVPTDNTLPDPYGGSAQAAYPWRGRMTLSIAPGRPGTTDKTAAAAGEIATFVGSATPSHFSLSGDTVVYSGPAEWSYRRMVLHQAMLAKAAGGVDTFVIGTELRGLTTIRSNVSEFPFVTALAALAADVKAIVGPDTKVTYAADWSEFFGYQPGDGSGDALFHLDPLWASPAIDAIGIDLYWPLSDWRDGRTHADYLAGHHQIYSLDYLKSNVTGGEGFDWYYGSEADRESQHRTPITDGLGKPWVFRYKDLRSWWQNHHFDRIAGVESPAPTAWLPQSKPFWFMETGCGAVDKGSNEPNAFPDPKSSENDRPHFSRGLRDDLIQRRYLQALIDAFDPAKPGYTGTNPLSVVDGRRMVDLSRIYVYAWDARPYPAFPANTSIWGDGPNWRLGHWLNGRFASAAAGAMVAAILQDYGFYRFDTASIEGTVAGYVIDRPMSARDALQAFELAFFIDTVETNGLIRFRQRGSDPAAVALDLANLVEAKPLDPLLTLTRGQEADLPVSAKLRYVSASAEYRQAVAESRRLTGSSGRLSQADLALVLDEDRASSIADVWLFETWAARERATFTLPPSLLSVEPGDTIAINHDGGSRLFRIKEIADHGARAIEALSFDPEIYGASVQPERPLEPPAAAFSGLPAVFFLDLPLLSATDRPYSGYVAATETPWSGGVAIHVSPETTGFRLAAIASVQATVGTLTAPLASGPAWRIDHANTLELTLASGQLEAVSRAQLLAGLNALAVRTPSGAWEVIQFEGAELLAPSTYRLSGLLRGQLGTETDIADLVPSGSPVVILDGAVTRIDLTESDARLPLHWRYGPSARSIGDASYVTSQHTFKAMGLRPLSPVHIRGHRDPASGDVTITWIRRTRSGGDSWDSLEVPLSEDAEVYELEILSGGTPVRSFTTTAPIASYSAAQQLTDFGTTQPAIAVKIAQLSTAFGRGAAAVATI